MDYTYKEIEELIARLHAVHPDRRVALLGRIKHFQRLGWPEGSNVGKGTRVRYDTRRTLSLVIAFELLDVGVTPERAVALLRSPLTIFPVSFLAALRGYRGTLGAVEISEAIVDGKDVKSYFGGDGDALLVISPSSMRYLKWAQDEERERLGEASFLTSEPELIPAFLRSSNLRQAAVLNISILIADFVEVARSLGPIDLSEIEEDLQRWVEDLHIKVELKFHEHPQT